MSKFAAVVRREIEAARLLFLGALLLGMVPLILPLLPMGLGGPARDLREAAATALAALVLAALVVALGASFAARDLASGRIRFYFSLPLAGWTIFGAKLAAAWLIATVCAGLVLAPAALLGDAVLPAGESPAAALALALVATLLGLLAAHALSVALRARSNLALVDLAAVIVLVLAVTTLVRRLDGWPGRWIFVGTLPWLAVATAGALVAGTVAPFVRARVDLRQAHRLQVAVLWPLLGVVLVAVALQARWWLASTPRDLEAWSAWTAASAEPWVVVRGLLHDRRGAFGEFLINTRTGAWERLGVLPWGETTAPHFSAGGGGGRLAWLEPTTIDGRFLYAVEVYDLGLRQRLPAAERLLSGRSFTDVALSPDGSLLAAQERLGSAFRLSVVRLADGALLGVSPLPAGSGGLRFLDAHRMQLVACYPNEGGKEPATSAGSASSAGRGGMPCETLVLQGPRGPATVAARWTVPANGNWELSPDDSRLLVFAADARRLYDTTDGRLLADVHPYSFRTSACWLPDGGLVLLDRRQAASQATYLSPQGEAVWTKVLSGSLYVGGALDAQHVAVARQGAGPAPAYLLDLTDGSLRSLGRDVRPLTGTSAYSLGYGLSAAASSTLFLRPGGELLDYDVKTATWREVMRLHGGVPRL